MRYMEQCNIIESSTKEEVMSIFQQEIEKKQKDGWQWLSYRSYISSKLAVPYGIEYTISKWERGDTND